MKIHLNFIYLLIVVILFTHPIFSQDQLKVEINNKKIRFKTLTYDKISENKMRLSIIDYNGAGIAGLTNNDFSIFRKSYKANILKVTPRSEVVDLKQKLVLLIDNSASMAPFIDDLTGILDSLVSSLSINFNVSVIMFDEIIDKTRNKTKSFLKKLPFTEKISEIKDYYNYGLKSLTMRTYLYDGIKSSIDAIRNDQPKKVDNNFIVLLTDGEDIGSFTSLEEIQKTEKKNIIFYMIDFMHSARQYRSKNVFLESIAKDSKGEYFSPNDINTLRANFRKIATRIINLGYEIDYEFKYPKPSIIFKLDTSEFGQRPEPYRSFQGMLFENMKISESFPLLNYIFFDKNSDEILSRYKHFSDSANIKGFSEEKIDGNAIDHYYHILNIFGKRLKENTSATITLIGNTDGTENNWEDLSLNRAKRIKKYFSEVWGIDPSRIQTLTGKLPGKPADTHIDEGKAENRRVECYSNNWEIVKPVTFTQDSLIVTPKVLDFKLSANNPLPIKKMTLDIFHDNIPWNFLQFNNRFDNLYQYNWRNKGNILPIGITQLDFRVKAFDNHGDSTISEISSLPIKEITTETIRSEKLNEKKLQKVSLILFDFDSYNTGERNETIMQEYVYPKLSDNTQYITVNGFTDNIGKPEYNLQLSTKRAEKISNMIGTKYPSDKIKFWGLGSQQPIYTNSLPEGRFYNRTVQIIFQNYKPW